MGSADVGKLQNHISVDAESVLNLCVFQLFMWAALLRLFACVGLLFFYLGLSAFGGIGLLVITIPINNYIIGKLKKYQQQLMVKRDKRMGVVNEAMQVSETSTLLSKSMYARHMYVCACAVEGVQRCLQSFYAGDKRSVAYCLQHVGCEPTLW
jgi:ABC transporter transmembrane region